jgi:hypothetical protein
MQGQRDDTPDQPATPPHVRGAVKELLDLSRIAHEAVRHVGECIAANLPNLIDLGAQGEADEIHRLAKRTQTAALAQQATIERVSKVTAALVTVGQTGIDPIIEANEPQF